MERRPLPLPPLLLTAGACLLGLARPARPAAESPAAPLERALAAAEDSLRAGDAPAAERRSRTALIEGWLLLARVEAASGRPADAEKHLREAARELERAVPPEPRDLELAFATGCEYLARKDVETAARLFAAVARERKGAQAHVLLGRAYRDFGAYGPARAELQAALQEDPRAVRAHYYLGTVAVKDKGLAALPEAIDEFEAELKIAPADPLASLELGVALVESQRAAEALPALETAARSRPDDARALAYLGRALLRLDRPADAAAQLERALQQATAQGANAPALLTIHLNLGQALARVGQAEKAAPHFAESQRLSVAGKAAERDQLARYMADSSDNDSSSAAGPQTPEAAAVAALGSDDLRALERAARGALAGTYLNLGVLKARAEQFAPAAEFLEQAAALDPAFPQVQSSLGVAYFNARLFDKATGPLSRAVAERPDDAALKRMLALAWLNLQEYGKAAELLAVDAGREADPSLQFAYGLSLVKSGRAAEAEGVFARLLARHGDSAEVSLMLGQAHAQQGDYDSAIQALKRALELKADVAEANATLGVIYLRQGRLPEAEQALRAELVHHPGDLQSMHNLAIVLESLQHPDEARGLLREVLKAKPELADARYLLGKILLAQGAATEAAAELEAAAKLNPDDPAVHYQLGQAYQKLGRTEAAQHQFELFREIKARR